MPGSKVPPEIVKSPSTSNMVAAVSVPPLLIIKLKKLLLLFVVILEFAPLNVIVPAPGVNTPPASFHDPATS